MFYFEVADQYPKFKTNLTCSANNCGKNITNKQPLFECSECKKCFHPHCKGVIGRHITRKATEPCWYCSDMCSKSKTEERNANSSSNTHNEEIMGKLQKYGDEFSEMKAMMAEIKKPQEFISSKFEKLSPEYKRVVDENKELLELLRSSNVKHLKQQSQINKLKCTIAELYQEKLECNHIVAGIPNEDVQASEIIKIIFNTLGCSECVDDVTQVQYLKQRFHHKSAPGGDRIDKKLLITFKDKQAKYKVQDKKKKKMIHLSQVGYNLPV